MGTLRNVAQRYGLAEWLTQDEVAARLECSQRTVALCERRAVRAIWRQQVGARKYMQVRRANGARI